MSIRSIAQFSPGRVILIAIFAIILLGTLLLSLPIARHTPMPLLDIFFTSTSVTCVTGLFTVPLDQFTFFGHCIILVLMQIGGLGIITLTLFLMSLFVNLGLATQLMAGQLLEVESWKNIKGIVAFIILLTIAVEFIGALLIWLSIYQQFPLGYGFFISLFHSISCFCSAGISLMGPDISAYNHNYLMLITSIILMLLGGIGFITLYETFQHYRKTQENKWFRWSLHSKIIMYSTAAIIITTTILIWMLEHNNSFAGMNPVLALLNALFSATSFRSTGLLNVPIASLQMATLFLIILTSFVGSAPGSTGSGIKVTTLAIFIAIVRAAISGTTDINIKSRRIAKDQVNKAIAILSLSVLWVIGTIFCLLITHAQYSFLLLVFEAFSAFAALGISLGVTPFLTSFGKLIIMASMIIGRIGSLTLILALRKAAHRRQVSAHEYTYPEERVMLS